jgi:hypothetical protein
MRAGLAEIGKEAIKRPSTGWGLRTPVTGDRAWHRVPIRQEMADKMGSANDMKAAEKTYGGFISLLKWSVPLIAVIALFVIFLIS